MDINKENIQAILVCRDASNIQIKEHFLLFNQIYFEFDNIFVNESTKLIEEADGEGGEEGLPRLKESKRVIEGV